MRSDDESCDLETMDLGELIEHITIDAYGNEGYWSFLQGFADHVQFPVPAHVIDTPVTVTAVDFDGDERRGLVATVEREGRTWTVSLIDLDIGEDQLRLLRLTNAYRRWLGTDG